MSNRGRHWNESFAAQDDPRLGWYEKDVSQTLRFLDLVPGSDVATIFLPGAGTSLLVEKLLSRGAKVILNEISEKALGKLRQRIGKGNPVATWLHQDIAKPLPAGVRRGLYVRESGRRPAALCLRSVSP